MKLAASPSNLTCDQSWAFPQITYDQIVEAAMADANLRQAAIANPGEKFELLFKNLLEALFVERMDQNEEIFARFMNDKAFQGLVTNWLATEAYAKQRRSHE